MSAPLDLFASCAPGLEPWLLAELRALGALDTEAIGGGVRLRGHRKVIYRINLESGLASHLLIRVAHISARRLDDLEAELRHLPWEQWLTPGVPRDIRVHAKKSKLLHTVAIAERAQAAIAARLRDNPEPGPPPVPVALRLFKDRVQVSVDTSGDPLHRRGYRLTSGPAPLREDLARALIVASGWDPTTPLVDPLCGVGTIPIEAAMLAQGIAPNRNRSFAFERTPFFHEPTWQAVREAADARVVAGGEILGRDRDPKALEASRANAERAGVHVRFEEKKLSEPFGIEAPTGAVVTHPPFGKRMDADRDLGPLYRALRTSVPKGWGLALMTGDRKLGMRAGSGLRTAFLTDAGGVKVRALVG